MARTAEEAALARGALGHVRLDQRQGEGGVVAALLGRHLGRALEGPVRAAGGEGEGGGDGEHVAHGHIPSGWVGSASMASVFFAEPDELPKK